MFLTYFSNIYRYYCTYCTYYAKKQSKIAVISLRFLLFSCQRSSETLFIFLYSFGVSPVNFLNVFP